MSESATRTAYEAAEVKTHVSLVSYLQDQGVPLRCNNTRAVAVWRGGSHLSVAVDGEKGIWYDHVTGKGGDTITACTVIEGLSFKDAVTALGDRYNVAKSDSAAPRRRERVRVQVPERDKTFVRLMARLGGVRADMGDLRQPNRHAVPVNPAEMMRLAISRFYRSGEWVRLFNRDEQRDNPRKARPGVDLFTVGELLREGEIGGVLRLAIHHGVAIQPPCLSPCPRTVVGISLCSIFGVWLASNSVVGNNMV